MPSPGSNPGSAPCSPWNSGLRLELANENSSSFCFDDDAFLQRAKRARLAGSPVQGSSTNRGLAAYSISPFQTISEAFLLHAAGALGALSSDYVARGACGQAGPSRLSCLGGSGTASLLPIASSASVFGCNAAGVFIDATAQAGCSQLGSLSGCVSLPQHSLQRSISNASSCSAVGWSVPVPYLQCGRAGQHCQAPCAPAPALLQQPPGGLSGHNLLRSWATAAGMQASSADQLVFPFVFSAGQVAAPATRLQQPVPGLPTLSWTGHSLCAGGGTGIINNGNLACSAIPAHYCGAGAQAQGVASFAGFAPALLSQLQLQQPCVQLQAHPAAPPQLLPLMRLSCPVPDTPHAARRPQCKPAPVSLEPHPLEQQPAAPQKAEAQAAAPPHPPSQLVRRARPLSPVPHSPSQPPRTPCSLGPEEWILHVVRCLGLPGADTPSLALHCWRRVSGMPQLHHATRRLPSLTIGKNLYATACLWVSIKLEEKRRSAPGGVLLAHMAATTPGALCAAELAVMNWLCWRPYDGYQLDESHLLVYM